MRDAGEFEDLDDQAVGASVSITAALQDVTGRGDGNALIGICHRSLNIDVLKQAERTEVRGEVFPPWAVYAVVGMLSIAACIVFFLRACWLTDNGGGCGPSSSQPTRRSWTRLKPTRPPSVVSWRSSVTRTFLTSSAESSSNIFRNEAGCEYLTPSTKCSSSGRSSS